MPQSTLENITIPSSERSRILDSAVREHRMAWDQFDADGDGALNRSEWREKQWAFYLIHDEDQDGQLNLSEWISATCPIGVPSDELYVQCRRFYTQELFSHDSDGFLLKGALDSQTLHSLLQADKNRNARVERSEYFGGI